MNSLPTFASPIQEMMDRFFNFDISGPVISSLAIMAIIAILCLIIFIKAKLANPLERPKGILLLAELFVEKMETWTEDNMGVRPGAWPGYFMGLFAYLLLAFIWSITGLPGPTSYLLIPFTLSLVMFTLIQVTALRYQKLSYFHRYIEPLKLWLPINLITMWTPIISTSLRMFGNSIAGSVVVGLISWVLRMLSASIFSAMGAWGQIFLAPIPIAVLNLYFALFSGFIQTLVFASLNAVWIGQEIVIDDPMGEVAQATRESRAQQ